MSEVTPYRRYEPGRAAPSGTQPTSLADVLDRVLDKGLVIAGDISISLAQVELITIKIRLLLASADKAQEMGIDWWTRDPSLSSGAGRDGAGQDDDPEELDHGELVEQNRALRDRVATLEERLQGLLHQPESTAASPSPISAADLLAGQAQSGIRGPTGSGTGGGAGQEADDEEAAADEPEDLEADAEDEEGEAPDDPDEA